MAEQNKDQVAELSAKLSALENESQRLLAALQWSSIVRNILLVCLVGFVAVFGLLYYRLYKDITERKLHEFQTILAAQQDELLEPLTKEAFKLTEDVGPELVTIFEKQIEKDGNKYVNAFNQEREILSQNLQVQVDQTASGLYEKLLNDHEQILREEFPQISSEEDVKMLHDNMGKVYQQLVQRYYIDYFHKEIERMALAIDKFPMAEPDESKGPLAQQVMYELMEMAQMMMVGPSDDLNLAAARESFAIPASSEKAVPSEQPKPDVPDDSGGN
jgi:hypothetical protein